jgi:hypothetical protein
MGAILKTERCNPVLSRDTSSLRKGIPAVIVTNGEQRDSTAAYFLEFFPWENFPTFGNDLLNTIN